MLRNVLLFSIVLIGAPLAAEAQVTLKTQVHQGKRTVSSSQVEARQKLTLGGSDVNTSSSMSMSTVGVAGSRDADGQLKIAYSIDGFKAAVNVNGVKVELDTSNDDTPEVDPGLQPLLDILQASAKSEWTTTFNADNKAVSVDGRFKSFESLPGALQQSMKWQLDSKYLTQATNDELGVIPKNPVKQGDTWTQTATTRLDSGQSLTFTRKFTYEGTTKVGDSDLHRISEKIQSVAYGLSEDSTLPWKLSQEDLKAVESDGTILFDNTTGQIQSRHWSTRIVGSLSFDVGGKELPAELDLKLENKTDLKDE